MEKMAKKIIDDAALITVLAAVLYFFGELSSAADAVVYGIPVDAIRQDTWPTLVDGAMIIMMLPMLAVKNGRDLIIDYWEGFILGALIFIPCLLFFLFKRKYKIHALRISIAIYFIYSSLIVMIESSTENAREKVTCLKDGDCTGLIEVSSKTKQDEVEKHEGKLVSANAKYWVLMTKDGIIIIPENEVLVAKVSNF